MPSRFTKLLILTALFLIALRVALFGYDVLRFGQRMSFEQAVRVAVYQFWR